MLTTHLGKVEGQDAWGIAPSTYYAFKKRPASARAVRDEDLREHITRVFHDPDRGRGLAGARKMWHLLARDGVEVARCTVERLMRDLGLRGARRGGYKVVTTIADPRAVRPPDLVQRDFTAPAPNRLWLVDFTYVPTWSGMVFTAFVTDAFSRRIVGWRTSRRHLTELPLDALEMALWVRGQAGQDVTGVVHHSDAGSEYTAIRYRSRLDDVGALASIGTVGDSYDNALAETTIGLYKTECIHHEGPWRGAEDIELATCSWVDWFNHNRLHSELTEVTELGWSQVVSAKLAELLIWQASVWRSVGEPDRAELLCPRAFMLAEESAQTLLQIRSMNLQSALAYDQGRIVEASEIEALLTDQWA